MFFKSTCQTRNHPFEWQIIISTGSKWICAIDATRQQVVFFLWYILDPSVYYMIGYFNITTQPRYIKLLK